MKLLFTAIILSAFYLFATNTEKPQIERLPVTQDTTLILDFVKSDTFIQKYMLNPGFRIRVREAEKRLK